jgi:twin arginine-targeting protein translocase, TatA/E family
MLDFSSPFHIILIILIIVLLFGGRKIPELMKGIGQGMREFKKASKLDDEPEKKESDAKDKDVDNKVSEKK